MIGCGIVNVLHVVSVDVNDLDLAFSGGGIDVSRVTDTEGGAFCV